MKTILKSLLAVTLILGAVSLIPVSGGCQKKKAPPAPTLVPTKTPVPTLEKIVYTYNGRLYWVNTDGSARQELFPDTNSKWFPSVSPDGWYIMYWVQNSKTYNLWLADLKKGRSFQVTFDNDTMEGDVQNFKISNSPSWSDDSLTVCFSRNNNVWRMTRDGFNQEAMTLTHDSYSCALSNQGRLAYAKTENRTTSNLYIKDSSLESDIKLTSHTGKKASSPYFSPDGSKIVYTLAGEEEVNIYMVNISTKISEPLTFDGRSHSPVFNRNGSKIVFSSFLTDKYQPELWIMNPDKSERMRLTQDGGVSPSYLSRILSEPLPTPAPEAKQPQQAEFIEEAPEEIPQDAQPTPAPAFENPPVDLNDLSVKTVKQGNRLIFYPVIHFDSASANIKSEFYPVLDDMMKIIPNFQSPLIIEGHTDNIPISTSEYPSNSELSASRAEAVKNYLVTKHGIPAAMVRTQGFGETRPLVPNNSAENLYHNRRAEVHIEIIPEEEAKALAQAEGRPLTEPTPVPTLKPEPTPTPKPKNIIEKIFPKKKKSKAAGW
jgi:flagellar motor protein MotB